MGLKGVYVEGHLLWNGPSFYWLFVSSGQLLLGCSRCGSWGLLSAVSMQTFRRWINATSTFGARQCVEATLAEFAWMTNCSVRSVYLELENMLLMNLLWFLLPHCTRTHTHTRPSVCLLLASPPTLSACCLKFTRSWPLGEVRVIHKRMANSTAWNLLLPSQNSTHSADFFSQQTLKK